MALQALFEMIDEDGSGTIDADELIAALRREGVEVSRLEVNQILRSFARSAASVRQDAAQELMDRTQAGNRKKRMSLIEELILEEDKGVSRASSGGDTDKESAGIDFATFLDAMRLTNGNCDWCVPSLLVLVLRRRGADRDDAPRRRVARGSGG